MKKTATQLSKMIWKTGLLALVIVIYSCSRNDDPTPEPQPQEQKIEVYIADNEINPSTGLYDGKIWKNDNLLYNYGEAGKSNVIYGLDIYGGKIYASGTQLTVTNGNSSYVGKIWENQTASVYGSGDVIITDILKSGNDTYFTLADITNQKTQIWKNGQKVYEIPAYFGVKIAVSGSDIYTCGQIGTNLVILKNSSILYTLSAYGGAINTLWLEGNTVYSAGNTTENSQTNAKVWKNGDVLYSLGEGDATDVCVSGNTVYNSGYMQEGNNRVAKVWKNGNILYTLSNGNFQAEALAVGIAGNNVYAAGVDNNTCKVWKNGELLYAMGNYALMQSKLFTMKLVPEQ